MTAFVVASKQEHSIRVGDFEGEQIQHALRGLLSREHNTLGVTAHFAGKVATINVVAQKEIACRCWIAAHFEQFHQVKVLAMHISAN